MPLRRFVSLDVETTGLDQTRDRITEVGMVRFTRDGVEDRYSQLVNPGREIPLRIQQLTGITPTDVAAAPHFNSVRLDIEEFIGEATVVGQNVGFDLSMLDREGIKPPGAVLDTLELARLVDPGHRSHNLSALAERYGVEHPDAHRALADAETTRAVFLALLARAEALPGDLIAELIGLSGGMAWSPATLLREIAGARGASAPAPPSPAARARPAAPATAPIPDAPPQPEIPPIHAPLDELSLSALSAGARHPEPFGVWEERSEQAGMTRAVARAMESGGQLLVEAGTGTGKSLAYLIPAALRALTTGGRAIVSTNTIALQEQLLEQDVPATRLLLRDALGAEAADALRVTTLKGRRNYLCRRRLAQERAAGAVAPGAGGAVTSEAGAAANRLLARLIVWLRSTQTGDRSELHVGPDEESAWSYFSAEGEDCLSSRSCPYVRDGSCFLLRARRRAEAAHIVIANHALLLSDMAAGGGVLPAADTLIADEGHHLEDAATQSLGLSLRVASFTDLLERVHRLGPRGTDQGVAGAARAAMATAPPALFTDDAGGEALRAELVAGLAGVAPAISAAAVAVEGYFTALHQFAHDHARGAGASDTRLRLTAGVRAQPGWSTIETRWDAVFAALRDVDAALASLVETIDEVALAAAAAADDASGAGAESAGEQWEGLSAELANVQAALAERCEQAGDLLTRHDAATVTWLDSSPRSEFATLHAAPLTVASQLQDGLFGPRRTSVVTGATLAVEGRFDFIQERLGLPDAAGERFGSPFDYRRAVRLLLPGDMPPPSDRAYQSAVEEALIDVAMAADGRTLALFTSHGALRAAARGVRGPLEEAGIVVLAQGVDGSPARVLQALRENPRSLLLGTASLWEGVDIPGDTVSVVVIARLPFAVPSDPVQAARADEYDNPFMRYSVPQAVTRFRQGFGRLIRRKEDRGLVVVLDGRLGGKRYGESFLRSLPPVTTERPPRHALAGSVEEWLAR